MTDMGDLDRSLIKEFSLVPAFYNKASPHFKNKAFIEEAWTEISKKLGYDVTMLKDRMNQLRNRYNLEKRKVIALKDDGIRNPKISWPLFANLRFLDNHIRPRKSYKGMMRKEGFLFDTYKDKDQDYVPNGTRVHAPRRGRPPLQRKEIKDESADNDVNELFQREYETEDDGGNDTSNNVDDYLNPANFLEDTESENNDIQLITDSNVSTNGYNHDEHQKPSLTVRNINCLKRSLQDSADDCPFREPKMPKLHKAHRTSDKFEAFGNFVTASLQDLPENKSLEIIEKFTNEIVRALIQN
ncbi:uncharacterized protein LOC119074416 [Bradysia coprophila]|uniref:uncharacterized protein LOC119074416 n=1 Tax=Bradysia coprophila TaxID=38358 RepID=UPI00187D81FB|nr:uncharacterized protein LOC119074416 [Bradysia coprophila]